MAACILLALACYIPLLFLRETSRAVKTLDPTFFAEEASYIDIAGATPKQEEFLAVYQQLTNTTDMHERYRLTAQLLRLESASFGTIDRSQAIYFDMAARFSDKLAELDNPKLYETIQEAPVLNYLAMLMSPSYAWLIYIPALCCICSSLSLLRKDGIVSKLPLASIWKYLQALLATSACSIICLVCSIAPIFFTLAFINGIGDASYPIMSNTTNGIQSTTIGTALIYQFAMFCLVSSIIAAVALLLHMLHLPRAITQVISLLPLVISSFDLVNLSYARFSLDVATAVSYIPAAIACSARLTGYIQNDFSTTPLLLARLSDSSFYLLILLACLVVLVLFTTLLCAAIPKLRSHAL